MSSASAIDPQTVQAYLETEYRVHGEPGFTLRVGQASAELLGALRQREVDCAAFVTACNPFSQVFDNVANAARQIALARQLTEQGLAFAYGVGKHPSSKWTGEESFLVFGLGLEAAKELGARLDQNGVIWSGADGVPQLILLR
jgi:hypothetical protein